MRIVLIIALALAGCEEEKKSSSSIKRAHEAVLREKAAQRVSDERKARLRTLRVMGFVTLSGGAVLGLVWIGRSVSQAERPTANPIRPVHPDWRDVRPGPPAGRIIEVPPNNPPTHRRQPHNPR